MSKRRGSGKGEGDEEPSDEELEEMLGMTFPIGCSGEACDRRSHLMLPGDSPFQGGLFVAPGWTAAVADSPPAILFFCDDCYRKEGARRGSGGPPAEPGAGRR
jgi:hypothetical protein